MSLQEKFQVIVPPAEETMEEHDWQWMPTTDVNGMRRDHSNNASAADVCGHKYNQLPPGMSIDNQLRTDPSHFVKGIGGNRDVSGQLASGKAFDEGFIRIAMKGADDVYTGEHIDHFYGEAIGDDGNEGFVERNNYLDRL